MKSYQERKFNLINKIKMAEVNLNVTELKGFVNHIISNNRFLQEENKNSVSVEIVGESGIGKTSTVVELAKENNLNYVKLNLAQIEELGDLVAVSYTHLTLPTSDLV